MNIGSLIFAAVILAMVVVGSLFVIVNQSSAVVPDTYGNMPSASVNDTALLVGNVTNVGVMAGSGMFLIMALLVVGCGVGALIVYAKSK